MNTIFALSNLLVMPFWLLMIVLPHWRWTRRIMQSNWVIAPAAVLYAVLLLPQLSQVIPALANPTATGVAALLGDPAGATIAWAHFLAFDLFVGRRVYLDSRQQQFNVWLMAPLLFLVLMVGPLGFLLYLLLRTAVLQRRQS